ncbi:glutamyl-Q tRNA(Asp) synthetase [Arenimonas maotaiensis]|uniref:Glutamyl-Q tRNA(Asp) synthetase n=1 Tax=Arenimonas maotaiensis TaxID=1446479 RepID=A0A917FRI2_9GAMM|nr:tRNA glutamyl-Q(34) synthetase GluQRS [Arenimonas maotaiensis]GGF96417.1 glutamyl-Q tRNA(Asp) synthetase [Arenimonas maotaiensis]
MTQTSPPRGRFAPSPTGPLHLGSLVAALGSYLMAKSHSGQWLIRVEDIDPPREIAGMARRQLDELARFGLESDEPVLYQSGRSMHYDAALARLLADGKAFYCSCTRTQLAAAGGIHRACVAPVDPRHAAIRLRVPDAEIGFDDLLYGRQMQRLDEAVGDVVLKRADGLYAYQLAVVVDDALQGITQVVRGADLLDSTPRQIFLQRQLGYPQPEYAHIPLVLDVGGHKLSKSHWAAALADEDRFEAFRAAWRHLGQDAAVLARGRPMAANLAAAVAHFDHAALAVTVTARARP